MTIFSGIRHKDYVVYVEKEKYENKNDFIKRFWFILKNINKFCYDELLLYSWYYVNIKFNNIIYTSDIQESLNKFIH